MRMKVMKIQDRWPPKCGSLHVSTAAISTFVHADEGHENTGQVAPQVWLSPCFHRCYLHLCACGWTCKMIRGSTSRNPGISSTSKVLSLQIAPFAHGES